MTPVAHWSEADYYRASRRARAAWEATQPQMTLLDHHATCPRRAGSTFHCWCGLEPEHHNGFDRGLEGADAGTTSLVASAPSSPTDGLEARERVALSRHDNEGCYSLPDSQSSVGLSERKDTACHSDGLAPSHPSLASSPPSPHADAARTSGSHSSGRGEGGLDSRRTDSVACPKCGAKPGRPCVTPSGVVRHDYPHKARMTARRNPTTRETPWA